MQQASETSIGELTLAEVQVSLLGINVVTEFKTLEANGVDGSMLKELTNESDVLGVLGVENIANCTRVIQLSRHMSAGKGLMTAVDIYRDGEEDLPHTWSVAQFAAHMTKNEVLKDTGDVFKKHKMAGDVILDMDLNVVTTMLPLTALQRLAFKKEIIALRKIIDEGPKDAVVHGPYLSRFCLSHFCSSCGRCHSSTDWKKFALHEPTHIFTNLQLLA